jgi:hypothetical protein
MDGPRGYYSGAYLLVEAAVECGGCRQRRSSGCGGGDRFAGELEGCGFAEAPKGTNAEGVKARR